MHSIQKVRRFALLVACTAAVAFLLTAPAAARADDAYAAIAYSPKTGAYGYGDKFDSRKAAEQKALAECKADDAQIIVWCVNNWCALAVGDNNAYGYGYNKDGDAACKTTLAECSKHGANSHIVICVSSDGQTKKP